MQQITWEDFQKIELRIGTIIEVKEFPQAKKPAYILKIDFGKKIGIKKSSAQITDNYTPETLIGKQILAVVNFPPKQIGPIMSECLVTGVYKNDGTVTLVSPDEKTENGTKLL